MQSRNLQSKQQSKELLVSHQREPGFSTERSLRPNTPGLTIWSLNTCTLKASDIVPFAQSFSDNSCWDAICIQEGTVGQAPGVCRRGGHYNHYRSRRGSGRSPPSFEPPPRIPVLRKNSFAFTLCSSGNRSRPSGHPFQSLPPPFCFAWVCLL